MGMHRCSTADGASIVCFCQRGADHDEEQFDRLVEDDPAPDEPSS